MKVDDDVTNFTSEGLKTWQDSVEAVSQKTYEYFEKLLSKSDPPTPRKDNEKNMQLVQADYFEPTTSDSRLFFKANQLLTLVNLYNSCEYYWYFCLLTVSTSKIFKTTFTTVYDPNETRSFIADKVINQVPNAFTYTSAVMKNGYHKATVSAYQCKPFVGITPGNSVKAENKAVQSLFVHIHNLSRFFAFFNMSKFLLSFCYRFFTNIF